MQDLSKTDSSNLACSCALHIQGRNLRRVWGGGGGDTPPKYE